MKTIYVDSVFLLNFIINYFILLLTARVCSLPLKRWRYSLGAALGALYSVAVLFPSFSFLSLPVLKLCLGAFMALISYSGSQNLIKPFLTFLAMSAAFGGAVFAISLFAGESFSGGFYINVSLRILLLSFAVCYFVLNLVFRRFGTRQQRETLSVSITLCGKTSEIVALRDTGNELYDPISGLPVMVTGLDAAKQLLPEDCALALLRGAPEFMLAVSEHEALRPRFRLVPYSAVGVPFAMLPVFKPDRAQVSGKNTDKLLVGLSPTNMCPDREFSAII